MSTLIYLSLCAIFFLASASTGKAAGNEQFSTNYNPLWGENHVTVLDGGTQVQIRIDPQSGGGFISKEAFGSGYFQMSMKIPKDAKGIITTVYLTSTGVGDSSSAPHDELDFELLGSETNTYLLNTNVFAEDSGNREQQFELWFDPTSDFHDYQLLWNPKQIVFFIDRVPIRVYKNEKNIGAKYPTLPMHIRASLWNSTEWQGPVNWNNGPFVATFREFDITGCPVTGSNPIKCDSQIYVWNKPENWDLNSEQSRTYEKIRNMHLKYDYCQSKTGNNFPECRVS